jgi:hypothetical protein
MTEPSDVAARLLDAHVAHVLERLEPARLNELIEREVRALFAWLAEIDLDDLVTRDQVNGVIDRYVINIKVSGALTELAGEMSRLVVTSPLSDQTRVDHVLPPGSFSQFADKLTGLDQLWRELLHLVARSDGYATLLSRTLQRGVLDVVFRAGSDPSHQTFIDGLLAKLRPVIAKRVEPYLSAYLEKLIKESIRHSEQRSLAELDLETVRGLVDEVWDEVGPMKLSDAFAFLGAHDLEDFVVLGYEFWQRYRKTRYFREISRELVGHFFTKYENDSISSVLDDIGVTEAMVIGELQGTLPALIAPARETGFLKRRIRAHLESFYHSDAATAILASVPR